MTEPRFAFYEIVRVRDTPKNRSCGIAGAEGAVLGIAPTEEGVHEASYAVSLYGREESWSLSENDLEPTGRMARREDFYSGFHIRVSRHGELLD
jgi:hypothetical protein